MYTAKKAAETRNPQARKEDKLATWYLFLATDIPPQSQTWASETSLARLTPFKQYKQTIHRGAITIGECSVCCVK